jgi:hypothetical protein
MDNVNVYHYEHLKRKFKKYDFPNGNGWHTCFHFLLSDLALDKDLVELSQEDVSVLKHPRKNNLAYRGLVRVNLSLNLKNSREVYNAIQQREGVQRWQKIAIGFWLNYTLVLDEERREVLDSLRATTDYFSQHPDSIARGGFKREILEMPMDKIRTLDKGPVIVTTSQAEKEWRNFRIQGNSLEGVLLVVQQATSIPRLVK